jgi:outer membrane protein TolC
LDVAQSEAQAAATRASLVTAQDSVLTNRAMLAFFTNAQTDKASLVDRLEIPKDLMTVSEVVHQAELQRLDILAAAEQVRVQQQNVETAIHEYMPAVTLDMNYYLHRDSFPTNVEWAGILTASVPIFSAGEIRADIRNAMSTLRQAVYSEWQLIRQVKQNVTIDWDNLTSSRRRIKELETETAASQEALRQAVERYGAGLAINLDVLNAETQLLSSQLSLAQERFNAKVFWLSLLRDMGKLPLPSTITSMSSATSRPTTQEISPNAPRIGKIGGMLPGGLTLPETQPIGAPATQPTTLPFESNVPTRPATVPFESNVPTQPTTTP